jgi:hypothetical protein
MSCQVSYAEYGINPGADKTVKQLWPFYAVIFLSDIADTIFLTSDASLLVL